MSINKSTIDYLQDGILFPATGRKGGTLNIVTGCRHYVTGVCNVMDCYAYRMVVNGRLKGHKSYPYKFDPTYHPERCMRKIGGKPKLLFLNDMGDIGGNWDWRFVNNPDVYFSTVQIAMQMVQFANANPDHIILLLTKNPAWYRFAEWPDNVWCGFTATNNEELWKRWNELPIGQGGKTWISLEPWLDIEAPNLKSSQCWLVIGGLSGPNKRPVGEATYEWLKDDSIQARRFTKLNAFPKVTTVMDTPVRYEYPEAWRVPS